MIDWAALLNPMKTAAGRVMTTPFNPNSGAAGLKTAPGTKAAPGKTPWLNREGFGGMSKGDLLLAGMGMLSGRNFGEGLANASAPLYGAMERQREAAEKAGEEDALTSILERDGGLDAETARAYAQFGPEFAASQLPKRQDPVKGVNINGKLVNPVTGQEIADFSVPKLPPGMVMNQETGKPEYMPEYIEGQRAIAEARGGNQGNVQSVQILANGEIALIRRDGTLEPTGKFARNPYQITDVGGVPYAIDRQTGAGRQVATPQEAGSNKATVSTITANEEDRRLAQKELPQAKLKLDQTIATVEQLIKHPGFDARYGAMSLLPAVPGTDMAGAQALIDQVKGQSFLQAFESLKGGGQITEVEGTKATQALVRANQAQKPEEARKAYEEFVMWAKLGYEKAQAQASGSYATQDPGAPALKFNPETGEFE
ncbi:hypothetical protein [Acidiphilium sp.]|uniref:hypothetical protein n=1 Tax=Acidiphilium sp. TaxID=527 RepID=UPI00258720E8|nr:hypothetical protein [Acidiphilium sp.]